MLSDQIFKFLRDDLLYIIKHIYKTCIIIHYLNRNRNRNRSLFYEDIECYQIEAEKDESDSDSDWDWDIET